MTQNTETALCVTCGEQKPTDRFVTGDCTCRDCHDEGRSGVYYDLDEETGVAVARRCDECSKPLEDHAKMWIDNRRAWICPGDCTDFGGDSA